MTPADAFADPGSLAGRLDDEDYLADEALATIAWLGLRLGRPLLLEGEPGTGKTALADALADVLGVPLVRMQCYEGIDATQALYDWDFPRQILHLRAVEALAATEASTGPSAGAEDVDHADATDDARLDRLEAGLFDERFLLARPVLRALQEAPCVLLVDEIDRADDEFEAFLLEVLSTWRVSVPELGVIEASTPPVVVLTSNRTRELHDALKRRCLYHWIDHPGLDREAEIVRRRAPEVSGGLARQVAALVQALRAEAGLVKAPGVAETIDWARALAVLGADEIDVENAAATLGVAVKHREDTERVRAALDRLLTR